MSMIRVYGYRSESVFNWKDAHINITRVNETPPDSRRDKFSKRSSEHRVEYWKKENANGLMSNPEHTD